LVRRFAQDVRISAQSTVRTALDRHGSVCRGSKRRAANSFLGMQLTQAVRPNDLWCADFKGEFKTDDGR